MAWLNEPIIRDSVCSENSFVEGLVYEYGGLSFVISHLLLGRGVGGIQTEPAMYASAICDCYSREEASYAVRDKEPMSTIRALKKRDEYVAV
jgi:hypothetical protein